MVLVTKDMFASGRMIILTAFSLAIVSRAEEVRLIRSVSGPSGKVVGPKFVLDEIRNRFVHPQDKSFVVFFEWEAPPGNYVLTAHWRRPDGQMDSISPDIKIETTTKELTCYWTYILDPEMMPGVWSVEVRINGEPAGAHSFEIAGTSPPRVTSQQAPATRPPTLDEIFRDTMPSIVWVRRFDAAGKRADTATGFVVGKDRVVTALQAVDGASKLEVEFEGGRKVETDELLAWSRAGDWAVIGVGTGDIPGLLLTGQKALGVGERVIVFNVEGGARAIGGVDISGKRSVERFGERIQLTPAISPEAAGGPLLNSKGEVAGILGGSVLPGSRFDVRHTSVNPALGIAANALSAATPASAISLPNANKPSKLSDLTEAGVLIAPLRDMDSLLYLGTSTKMGRHISDPLPHDVWEFSKHDKQVWVISEWQKRGKVSKGMLGAKVYDDQNHVRVVVDARKISLSWSPMRSAFSFETAALNPGVYRIDLSWDDQPVWRTFIRVTD